MKFSNLLFFVILCLTVLVTDFPAYAAGFHKEIAKNYAIVDVLPETMAPPWGALEFFEVQLWMRKED